MAPPRWCTAAGHTTETLPGAVACVWSVRLRALWRWLQFGHRDLRTWRHGLERLRQRKRRPGVQPQDRDLCAGRVSLKRLRHHKRRQRLQPENRGLCIHGAEFQCLRELGSLDGLEERQHCILAAQTNANGTTGSMTSSNGAKAYGASGANGNSAAVGQTANGNKYAAANGNTYSNTGSGWKGSSSNTPKYNTSSYSATEEQFNFQWLGRAGKERRIIGLQQRRRRLAIQGGKCSWLRKQGRRRWLGRSQVNQVEHTRENNFGERSVEGSDICEGLENRYVTSGPQNLFYYLVDASGSDGFVCRLQ